MAIYKQFEDNLRVLCSNCLLKPRPLGIETEVGEENCAAKLWVQVLRAAPISATSVESGRRVAPTGEVGGGPGRLNPPKPWQPDVGHRAGSLLQTYSRGPP